MSKSLAKKKGNKNKPAVLENNENAEVKDIECEETLKSNHFYSKFLNTEIESGRKRTPSIRKYVNKASSNSNKEEKEKPSKRKREAIKESPQYSDSDTSEPYVSEASEEPLSLDDAEGTANEEEALKKYGRNVKCTDNKSKEKENKSKRKYNCTNQPKTNKNKAVKGVELKEDKTKKKTKTPKKESKATGEEKPLQEKKTNKTNKNNGTAQSKRVNPSLLEDTLKREKCKEDNINKWRRKAEPEFEEVFKWTTNCELGERKTTRKIPYLKLRHNLVAALDRIVASKLNGYTNLVKLNHLAYAAQVTYDNLTKPKATDRSLHAEEEIQGELDRKETKNRALSNNLNQVRLTLKGKKRSLKE